MTADLAKGENRSPLMADIDDIEAELPQSAEPAKTSQYEEDAALREWQEFLQGLPSPYKVFMEPQYDFLNQAALRAPRSSALAFATFEDAKNFQTLVYRARLRERYINTHWKLLRGIEPHTAFEHYSFPIKNKRTGSETTYYLIAEYHERLLSVETIDWTEDD